MIIKNAIPVTTCEKKLLVTPLIVMTSSIPLERKTTSKEVKIIKIGLNLASQETRMAVKPLPPAVALLIVWLMPATRRNPVMPQIKPDKTKVRMMTFFTLIPI